MINSTLSRRNVECSHFIRIEISLHVWMADSQSNKLINDMTNVNDSRREQDGGAIYIFGGKIAQHPRAVGVRDSE